MFHLLMYLYYLNNSGRMLTDIENYKNQIPEFVIKLYHILDKPEYHDFITWAAHDTEILIKQPKKLQDKVLPYFFRHKHLSSFIRQLNMYRFSKVNKISKQRSWMYFKNDYFKKGDIQLMRNIKRTQNNKKKDSPSQNKKEFDSDANTIKDQSLIGEANNYRYEAERKFGEIQKIVERILQKNPEMRNQFSPVLEMCQGMTNKMQPDLYEMCMPSMGNILVQNEGEPENVLPTNIMLGSTVRQFVPMQSIILPSICSFSHFDGL